MNEAEALDQTAQRYRRTKAKHDEARAAAVDAAVAALRAGMTPTEVTRRSPFTAAYVRRIAREHGIEPARPGPKKEGEAGGSID